MLNSENHDASVFDDEEDGVTKACEQRAPQVGFDRLVCVRQLLESAEQSVDRCEETVTLVELAKVAEGVSQVLIGGLVNDDLEAHRYLINSARTSDHGRVAVGFA